MGSDRTFGQLVADYLVSAVEADGTFVRITDPDILVNTSTRTRVEARFDQPYGSEIGFHFHTRKTFEAYPAPTTVVLKLSFCMSVYSVSLGWLRSTSVTQTVRVALSGQ